MIKNNFTKNDISKQLSTKIGYSTSFSKKLINDLINILIFDIKKGNLYLKNIGSFKLIDKKERIGRNPKTKETFTINSRKSISFISSDNLKKSLNKNG